MSSSFCCRPTTFAGNKPALEVGNSTITLTVGLSGCQILRAAVGTGAEGAELGIPNPFWVPPWPTVPAALRRAHVAAAPDLFSNAPEDKLESELLACIGGHSLCCDVFGAHSLREVEVSGLSFHGEAGLRQWEVQRVDGASVTLAVRLQQTQLEMRRTFTPAPDGSPVVRVTEEICNLVGFERAMGATQHVSLGADFIADGKCRFSTNCDKGMTWPHAGASADGDVDPGDGAASASPPSFFAPGQTFNVAEGIPRKDGGVDDWSRFPRCERNSDLCTMRVSPQDEHGWFVVERPGEAVFAYAWKRQEAPWLMTWEENNARAQAPWSSRTVVRGLEFGSYALATSRRDNVQRGTSLFGVPAFAWLDAHEVSETTFWITLQGAYSAGADGTEAGQKGGEGPIQLVPDGATLVDSNGSTFSFPLH